MRHRNSPRLIRLRNYYSMNLNFSNDDRKRVRIAIKIEILITIISRNIRKDGNEINESSNKIHWTKPVGGHCCALTRSFTEL